MLFTLEPTTHLIYSLYKYFTQTVFEKVSERMIKTQIII